MVKAIQDKNNDPPVEIFSTCPNSSGAAPDNYLKQVADVARWSEQNGCRGILVYTDNSLVDPWLVSQIIIENTTVLCPLVAVQPAYAHPYTVAKMAASFAFLSRPASLPEHGRGGVHKRSARAQRSRPHTTSGTIGSPSTRRLFVNCCPVPHQSSSPASSTQSISSE